MGDYKLAYSTDPEQNRRCSVCKELVTNCGCAPWFGIPSFDSLAPVMQLERKGRGGKSVTVLRKLPPSKELLELLTGKLKKRCGTGGTYKIVEGAGLIEIQGDKQDELRKALQAEGIVLKG
jgi:translation initiation factor 1